ncbi:MAG: hypothetical protein A2Y77_02500 [Planctomycetes bacterium RBG_13_62_9]|nr:MAG: hypothetical protein A2Y77_02500 [Planctomycetes bacterium RBG_13_62_9]
MLLFRAEQSYTEFYRYPSVGVEDYRYQYPTALVRVLELQMVSRATLADMANTQDFKQAAELLSGTEYALPTTIDGAPLEEVLQARRTAIRDLFADLIVDEPIVQLFRSRDDFANLRLAVRRAVTDRPIGADFSPDGNVSPKQFEQVFAEENYDLFPDYLRAATERAVLAYYQNKDIRQIDYAIDDAQSEHNLATARTLKSVFLLNLFRIEIDLTNIRTMLRLKFAGAESAYFDERVFLKAGFLELDRLRHAMDLSFEAMGPLFYITPYHELVEAGAGYLASQKSFLKLEQRCDEHLLGYLRKTLEIVAGPQPVIAFLLMKEHEIRMIRLILTAKRNNLDTKLILDRVA